MTKAMKTTILLLIISVNLSAQIQPIASIETGLNSKTVQMYKDNDNYTSPNIDRQGFYSDIVIGAKYKGFKLTTDLYTYFQKGDSYTFRPWLSVYQINASYTYKSLTFGYYHECVHLVRSQNEVAFRYGGSEDRLFVKWVIR